MAREFVSRGCRGPEDYTTRAPAGSVLSSPQEGCLARLLGKFWFATFFFGKKAALKHQSYNPKLNESSAFNPKNPMCTPTF